MKKILTNLRFISAGIFVLFGAIGVTCAQDVQTLYVTPSPPTWRDNYTGASGCKFVVGPSNVVVSHLGFFQSNAVSYASIVANGGLNTNHYVAIYSSAAPPVLLAQVIVPLGTSADYYTNQFCWMPLDPPFLLISNTAYYVAALPYNGDNDWWGDSFTATFNGFFVGSTTNTLSAPATAYGPGNATWPTTGFSTFGSNTTYCVESMANLPIDKARVAVLVTNFAGAPGGTISVFGYASGAQPINYQWWVGSPPVPVTWPQPQTNATLNIPSADITNTGTYFLTASNAIDGERSANVQVLVSATPVAVQQDLPTSVTNFANYPLTMSVVVTGSPPILLEWFTNGVAQPSTIAYDLASFTLASSYSLITAYPANNTNYNVVASNKVSSTTYYATSSVAKLTVLPNLAYPQEFLFDAPPTNTFYNQNAPLGSAGNNMCGGRIVIGSQSVVVTHLGYDAVGLLINNQAALLDDHNVGLFNAAGTTLLGSVLVTNGTPTNSEINGYFWVPLSPPLLLVSNTTYILAAQTFANGTLPVDPWGDLFVPAYNPYFSPGGPNNQALYGNVWPTAPASGGYGSQFYSAPNMAILTNYFLAFVAPTNVTLVKGATNVTLTASVDGQAPITLVQWYTNGTPLAGQTNTTLTFAYLDPTNAGNYYVVATNYQLSTAVTSDVATVTVLTSPVILGQFPVTYTNILNTNLMTVYAGANPALSLSVIGVTPLYYQWYTNGTGVGFGTSSNVTLPNVQGAFTTYCIITNSYGSATSAVWSASVLAAPTAPYPQTVMALNPIGYWRLNDTNLDGVDVYLSGDNGYICHDYISGNNGIFTNVYLGQPGYNPTSDPTTTSAEFDYVNTHDCDANSILNENLSVPNGANAELTVEAWVNGQVANGNSGIANKGYFNVEEFSLDCGGPGNGYRFEVRNAATTVYNATNGFVTSAYPGDNQWHHLVGVCDEANGLVTLYIDGKVAGTTAIPTGTGLQNSDSTPMDIGARPTSSSSGLNNQFGGFINDVAIFNQALNPVQVAGQYASGAPNGSAPVFIPTPVTARAASPNGPLAIPVTAIGTGPIGYQWINFTTSAVLGGGSGTTNGQILPATFVTNSTPIAWNGQTLELTVTNAYGSTNLFVTITVYTNNAYATNILSLNPIAYWPMHEAAAAAPGDIETNYGTLGLVGTGYYPDWTGSGAGGNSAFQHGFPSAIASDSDPSVCFNTNASVGNGAYTNALYIPNASRQAVLYPPFSVECWFFPSNTSANDLWSQEGYEGLNQGTEGAGTGTAGSGPGTGTNICGIRLYVGGNYNIYTYFSNANFAQPLASVGTVVATNWYHVVVTCDASTNMSLYTNGVQCGTTTAYVGLYYPDYWTHFEVGSGRGNTRAKNNVAVDEFAIYTNVLALTAITNHFMTGTNPSPATSYFATVTNDKPVIYYRMDSPAYSAAPPVSTWPVLQNFGSVPAAGVYTPGTMLGVLPGPNTTYTEGTNVAMLQGVSSFADAGYNAALDPSAKFGTGSNAFSVVAMFRGNPANNTFQCLVGHSDGSWRMTLGANAAGGGAQGSVQFTYGATASSTNNCNDGKWHQAVGVYQPAPAGSASPGSVTLYVDGQFNTVNGSSSSNGIAAGAPLYDVLLGAAPDYTNNPLGLGRQFNGELCDVAVFTNALTASQVRALYFAAGGVEQPLVMPYSGQLPVTWNYLGSNLGNNMGPTNLLTLYAGASPSFMVAVSGVTVYYQWYTNGAAVGFGTGPILTLPNVQSAFTTYCIATNSINSVTSVVWSASVVADPDAGGSFSQTIMSDNPMAYWRLNETNGSTVAIDYAGGANGLYGSQATNGLPGVPIVAATPELGVAMYGAAANNQIGTVTNAGIVLFTNAITFVVWQLPYDVEGSYRGTFVNRSTANFSGAGLSGGGTTWGAYWNGSSAAYGFNSGLAMPVANQWFMGVVEIFPQYYVLATFTNTSAGYVLSSYVTNSTVQPMGWQSFYGGAEIGADNGTANGRIWNGKMNELAIFNYDLSPAQLNALYIAGTNNALGQAFFVTQPQNVTTVAGTAKTNFTVAVSSFLTPLTYGWYYNGTASYAGATALTNGVQFGAWFTNVATAQLTLTNVTFGAAGYYFVAVTTAAGTTNSAIAQLTVTPLTSPSPSATLSVSGNQLTLGWPANYTGWRLQAMTNPLLGTNNLVGTNWANVTGATSTNKVVIPMDVNKGSVLYRLIYP